jgi:hypothetical protein
MDSFVAVIAVAAWLVLMVPAAFVLFLGGTNPDSEERPTQSRLALVPLPDRDEPDDRLAA